MPDLVAARLASVAVRVLGRPLERRDAMQSADVIVVLGSPLRADGSLSAVVEERVQAGVAAFRTGLAPLLCMTGGRGPGISAEVAEAEAMAKRALELGVPASALVVEDKSRNTSTNARNVATLLGGPARVIVVTQPFHSRRAVLWFQRCGFSALAWPMRESIQYREPRRGLRWVVKEYGSLARDLFVTRKPGE